MKKLFLFVLCASLFIGCKKEAAMESATTTADTATTVAPVEFADAKYSEIGKNHSRLYQKVIWMLGCLCMLIMQNFIGTAAIA